MAFTTRCSGRAGSDDAAVGRSRSGRAVAAVIVIAMSLGLAPASGAGASEPPRGEDAADARPVLLPERFERPVSDQKDQFGAVKSTSLAMWPWAERGWGYFLTDGTRETGFRRLVKVDAASGRTLGSEVLNPAGYFGSPGVGYDGQPGTMALDAQGGRLFYAYQNPEGTTFQHGFAKNPTTFSHVPRGELCVTPWGAIAQNNTIPIACVAGVAVVDADSLEVVRRISLQPVRVEGGAVGPHLLDLAWSPPRGPGDAGKVHLLVMEYGHESVHNVETIMPRRSLALGVVYLVQMDPETGVQEWSVRVDACRGGKEAIAMEWNAPTPYGGAVFRSSSVADPAIFVGCVATTAQTGAVVKVPLDGQGRPAGLPVEAGEPTALAGQALEDPEGMSPQDVARPSRGQATVLGPDKTFGVIADAAGGRMLMKTVSGPFSELVEVWWAFDTSTMRWVGTVGIGSLKDDYAGSNAGLDPTTGRLYVLASHGLYLADMRRTPLGQALVYPEFGGLKGTRRSDSLTVVPAGGEGGFPRVVIGSSVVEDRVPVAVDSVVDQFAGRTVDIEEAEGVTSVSLDGAARGFGARLILVSGVDGAARVGPADPIGRVQDQTEKGEPGYVHLGNVSPGVRDDVARAVRPPCSEGDRDLVVAFVGPDGPVVVDGTGARGSAEPVVFDSRSRADFEAAPSRCSQQDWAALWGTALFGQAPVGEPQVPWVFSPRTAACVSPKDGEGSSDRVGDSVAGTFAAGVSCGGDEASGHAYARGFEVGGLGIGEALSSFRIYRDPGRGVVSRVESVARGVGMAGLLRIETVRGSAESWANGRAQPVAEQDEVAGYDPNCDYERSAGTCFQRHVFGVWTPGYSCGPCGDEAQLAERLNRALATHFTVQFRDPDEVLARGAPNGYIAAVQKPDQERFADLVLNNDLLQTVVPTLEIIRYSPPNRGFQGGGPRGRQIIQLAGVEVSSSYGISCLLVYDAAANTCAAAAEPPGSIQVSLADGDGKPLAGGAFEVRADVDADGVLGLKDTLLPDGACVTADDGIGTCTFEGLQPGSYLVSQVAAPPGYAKSTEPWVSEVASGEARTVAFTNVSNVSTINMTVTDEHGAPLSGATFAAYPDPDSDGKVAPDAQPAATCTTDGQGACTMKVPAGSYVLVQTAATGGLEGIEPVPFTFASGGQVAAVTVVNYPPASPQAPEGAASPAVVDYSPPVGYSPPVESIDRRYEPADSVNEPVIAGPSVPEQIGGTVVRVIRAPGDALRLLSRDPQQAIAWTAALALLCLAVLAVRRRSLLSTLTLAPASLLVAHDSRGGGAGSIRAASTGTPRPGSGPATLELERPEVAGAAPPLIAGPVVSIVAAVTSTPLASVVRERLQTDARCSLLSVAGTLADLRALLRDVRPDVLVLDLAFPTELAEDVCDLLPGLHPPARTVGLIPPNRSADALITRGYAAGLGAILHADEDLSNGQLALAVRTVARGRVFYGPAVASTMKDRWSPPARRVAGLTDREVEVARLAAQGMRRTDIAQHLYLSPQTVKGNLRGIRAKLGITDPWSHHQLRRRLLEIGLLDPETDTTTDGQPASEQ